MITYFKVVYRRHTNFSMESIEQMFDGTVDFGRKVSALISRNGDLITGAYVQALLPDLQDKQVSNEYTFTSGVTALNNPSQPAAFRRYTRWIDNVGHYLLKQVDIEIGGQLIDRHYSDWLEIWAQLTVPAGRMLGYRKMIGQDPKNSIGQNTGLQADIFSRTAPVVAASTNPAMPVTTTVIKGRNIFVPLQFWFCRNEGLALPLIALQYHEVKIVVEFRSSYDLVQVNMGDLGTSSGNASWATFQQYTNAISTSNLIASLWVDYIYLDTDERKRFAQVSHEYLIEQLQFTGDESVQFPQLSGITNYRSLNLNYSHPVKELIWVIKAFEETKEWCNFTDTGLFSTPPVQTQYIVNNNVISTGLTGLPASSSYSSITTSDMKSASLSAINTLDTLTHFSNYDATRPAGRWTANGLARNPVHDAQLLINGQGRFARRPGSYFNWVQPGLYHTNIPASPGINVYSFALEPEGHNPSGTCNFSRINKAKLLLNINTTWRDGNCGIQTHGIIRVFAVNYNILRIMSGMGGLAYTT